MKNKYLFRLLVAVFLLGNITAKAQHVTLLSGLEGGSYFQVASDIKNIAQDTVNVLLSKGSYYNFVQLKNSKVDVAFVQYDVLYLSSYGFEELKKIKNIKVLLPLGKEEIHLFARANSNINSIMDLEERKVGIGSRQQGTNITASFIREKTEINWKQIEVPTEESFAALLNGDIDAFFFVGAIPVEKFAKLAPAVTDKIKLIPLQHSALDKTYAKAVIKKDTYSWLKEDIETYSVSYALAANITEETPEDYQKIEKLLTNIKDNINKLKKEGHPVWKQVDFNFEKVNSGIHPAAIKVFNIPEKKEE